MQKKERLQAKQIAQNRFNSSMTACRPSSVPASPSLRRGTVFPTPTSLGTCRRCHQSQRGQWDRLCTEQSEPRQEFPSKRSGDGGERRL